MDVKQNLSLSLEETLIRDIDRRARACGLARSNYVEMALLNHVGRGPELVQRIASQLAEAATAANEPLRRRPIIQRAG